MNRWIDGHINSLKDGVNLVPPPQKKTKKTTTKNPHTLMDGGDHNIPMLFKKCGHNYPLYML